MHAALILDAEAPARKSLQGLLARNCPRIGPILQADTVRGAQQILDEEPIDLIFLDVNLGTGTGFELLERTLAPHQQVIFISAHEGYCLRAIRANAVDYLLKPVDIDELKSAVDKATDRIRNKAEVPPAATHASAPSGGRLLVHHEQGFEMLDLRQLIVATADRNYTSFYLEGRRKVVSSRHLGSYEDLLPESSFFRSHKSCIINLQHLKGYSSREGCTAMLSEGCEAPVSRRRLPLFLERSQMLSR